MVFQFLLKNSKYYLGSIESNYLGSNKFNGHVYTDILLAPGLFKAITNYRFVQDHATKYMMQYIVVKIYLICISVNHNLTHH